jgi:hypothetical protein
MKQRREEFLPFFSSSVATRVGLPRRKKFSCCYSKNEKNTAKKLYKTTYIVIPERSEIEFNIDMRGMSLNWFLSDIHTKMDVLDFNLFYASERKYKREGKMLNIN